MSATTTLRMTEPLKDARLRAEKPRTSGGGFYDPWLHAADLGILITVMPLPEEDGETVYGFYEHPGSVFLLAGMSQNQMRATLAHEVQHALRGDVRQVMSDEEHAARERLVDEAAASLLMPEDELRETLGPGGVENLPRERAERFLADHFRVDLHVVQVRLSMLGR